MHSKQYHLGAHHLNPKKHFTTHRLFRGPTTNCDTVSTARIPAVYDAHQRIKCDPARFDCIVIAIIISSIRIVPPAFRSRRPTRITTRSTCDIAACISRRVRPLVVVGTGLAHREHQQLDRRSLHQCVAGPSSTNTTLATTRNGENNLAN